MAGTYYSRSEALERIKQFCSFRDRSHKEVWEKLKELNQDPETSRELIAELLEEKFLDEERFARAYVSGKFRNNKWGRLKIKQGLREKGIHPNLIRSAMTEIDEAEYLRTLQDLLEKKLRSVTAKNQYDKKAKSARYLIGKGYEQDIVWRKINEKLG